MRTQRLRDRPKNSGRTSIRRWRARFVSVITCFALAPFLVECSSFSSQSSSAANSAGAYQPVAAQPVSESTSSLYPYPNQSLVDLLKGSTDSAQPPASVPRPPNTYTPTTVSYSASQPPAQPMPHPPSTYTPSAQPYEPNQPGYSVPAPAAPPATAAAAPSTDSDPPPSSFPYPQRSLWDIFSR
jgi:hypothetical protein